MSRAAVGPAAEVADSWTFVVWTSNSRRQKYGDLQRLREAL
jgi:hypothetical protein